MTGTEVVEVLALVRERGDRAGELARSAAPVLLAAAVELHAAYRAAVSCPEAFARGVPRGGSADLVERSVRAELAVGCGVSERVVSRDLEDARLLIEDLPRTREALAGARLRWEAGRIICATAASLPPESRAVFDERACELALVLTPTQLRRRVARLRDELHVEPLADRHARAREDRAVWLVPNADGMALLCALLPAPVAIGAYARLDRIARCLRDSADDDGRDDDGRIGPTDEVSAATKACGEQRTLAQLRADALADLLCDGDVFGTTPPRDGEASDKAAAPATFVPGVRAEVRLTLTASTATGRDDAPADLDEYGLIPAHVARELAGAATTITRVLTDPVTGTVVSVGRTHRLPPPRMRLALQLRDRTCRFPGCTRPASRAEADHSVEWRHGGETSLENLASLCTAHHHVRHGDRWTYVLHPDGTTEWTTPTGRRITTRPGDLLPDPPRRRPAPLVKATCTA
ncbi:HNH endonuclease signature motif containing protein [Rathayibacter sp. Leaf248]|uniref:HNH endonuclease signature motif containing protein n=1 Tax=Rathayibacter sp. Leaf248 TaxID=2876555 RepID=UPI001E57A2A9|nr:HNH endonuclease signature motif containing protein [Rathayibacter sp. Leaf248]